MNWMQRVVIVLGVLAFIFGALVGIGGGGGEAYADMIIIWTTALAATTGLFFVCKSRKIIADEGARSGEGVEMP